MGQGRLAIHGHFYQPIRTDPFSGTDPDDRSAAPFPNWTARIAAECYRPNADRGNFDRIGFDVGPTLTAWLAAEEPALLGRIAAADGGINALAQGFHHAILPLASARDRTTEIRWGLADFAWRFGRTADGFWLPETAADLPTLRALASEGVRYTILAPWQGSPPAGEVRRPYRVDVDGRRSLIVMFYDGPLSGAISFVPEVTADADRFAEEHVRPALKPSLAAGPAVGAPDTGAPAGEAAGPAEAPLLLVATDGELYGHHQRWRDLFLARLLDPDEDRGFEIVSLGAALAGIRAEDLPPVAISGRSSWSCHHGVLRWSAECPCVADGRWKAPLRAAFERLAGAIDAVTDRLASELPGRAADGAPRRGTFDPWAARDAYVEVVIGRVTETEFAARWLAPRTPPAIRARFLSIMEAQRWRLAMFASCGWFWEDPTRPETQQVLRCAARASRLIDGLGGTSLERGLLADLALLTSPATGEDGVRIYGRALRAVGQRAP